MMVTNNEHYFLAGGGEMGKLIREKDWSKTSLGHPDTWPQSLRTTLSIILNSKFPMFLFWGSELISFYNDAYRPSLGNNGKHPNILGQKGEKVWPEIWSVIHPLIKQVLAGEGSTWSENQLIPIYRNGKLEDVYWTFSYSPVFDESEKIAGVMVICNETTENVTLIKKLEESNNRFLNNIIQAPTAMCVFRGKNHVVEIANDMMLEIWGKSKIEVINKPIFEGLTEAKGQGLEVLLDKVFETGEKFVANERPLQLPRNGKIETIYINFVYEAIKETDGKVSGIVAIAIEVTAQVVARFKVEESDHKVRAVVENAPFPIAVYVGKEMRVELANESIIKLWGKGNDVIGKSFREVLPELNNQLVFEQIKNVLDTGQSFHTKNTPLDLIVEGEIHTYYFNYSLTPLYDVKGKVYAVMNTGVDLTDLNLAKKRIEESDKRFRNTVKQAPVGITILRGPNHVVEMANEAYLDLVDIRETEFVGRPIFESMPEAEGAVGSLLNNVFKTGIPYHGNEMPITIKRYGKEEVSYFDFLYHPLKEEDEKISGIIVTVTEVTEKVEARKKTEQNEQRLNIIVDASELGTWELNVITKEVQYSKRFFEIICGSQDEENLCHEQLVKHIHPDDLHIREEAFKKSITSGYLHYEARVIWKDQSIHWVEAKGKVFYDKENKPEKLLGTLRDITDERCHQQELEESEQKFRLLANSMPQHIWTSDTEGNLNYFNQSVYNYTGLTREQIDKTGWLQIVHPNDREENIKLWMDAIATGKDFLFEHRFRRHDGEYRWQLSRAIPQIDENGKIQMWVGSSTDIQEQKIFTNELEKQVSERTKQLEQNNIDLEKINKELQSFAYISSHDLQEPLRKIQTFATQIMDRESQNLSENGKDKFKRMQGAAQRMQALINDLLAYSKTNIQERKFEKTDLNKIIDDVKEDLRDDLEQKHINIEIDEICEVNVIPFQFRQLIYNLVSNSIKFSKPDIALIIKIKCKIAKGETLKNKLLSHEKEYCYISIADNGIGFDQEYSKKIFELFQRLHGRSEYAGTGIGLAIVKKIVENHNGFIIAEGELNKGATFDIYFPTT